MAGAALIGTETPPLTSHSETVLEILNKNKEEAALVYEQTSRNI